LEGTFSTGLSSTTKIKVIFQRNGQAIIKGDRSNFISFVTSTQSQATRVREAVASFAYLLAGLNNDALIVPPYFYFHSYRKVQEGNLELSHLVERNMFPPRFRPDYEPPISIFKREVLQLLMGQSNIFEDVDSAEASTTLDSLNALMKEYAGGTIGKLRTSAGGIVELPIAPSNGGPAFTFDGLSSGQKEIISTLFLIWHYTRSQPGIVLIDEPELHLNAEWHRSFIRSLHRLAPDNQYIIATHSEDVFAAVDKDRRLLLASTELLEKQLLEVE
jgi:hypothetical protein